MKSATQVVDTMYNGDAFSQWLGIERLEEGPGYSKVQMTVRPEMTNGFKIAHGGISYSLADSALAFASNGHGTQAVSLETSISHTKPVQAGDTLLAVAEEKNLSRKTGLYEVRITNQLEELVALFKGTVYRTGKAW
jgi:acyl-CoA thioesterase